jgi:diacylglycerol O-acyltransferase
MDEVPLQPEDRAILALESDTIAGHTCKVVVVGTGAPDLAALRASVADRIGSAPALTRRLGGTPDEPAWVPDEGFDVADHIVEAADIDGPVDASGLRTAVASLFEEHLDRAKPLWRMDLVPMSEGGAALVWRIHHALADGTAAMRYAQALLWDPAEASSGASPHAAHPHAKDDERRRGHLAGFLRREFARSHGRSPFDGSIGRRRQVAFASVSLPELHDAAKTLDGATVNDAVLATVAGALRRWLEHHHGSLGELRVQVPVSLHHEGDDAANRDSFFSLALPLNEPDAVERLRAVHAATSIRKADHDAEEMETLLRELSRVSPSLERFCGRLEDSPRRFALSVSNVPGPRDPVSVLGSPVKTVHAIVEIGEHHALRVAVVSLGEQLCYGFCADPAIVHDLKEMPEGVEAEAARLIAEAG